MLPSRSTWPVLLIVGLACQPDAPPTCELGKMTKRYSFDDTVVFELPDSGGFLANGAPITRADLGARLQTAFARRKPTARAILVESVSPARCKDLAYLIARAGEAGVAVFDRRKSGWPDRPPLLIDTVR